MVLIDLGEDIFFAEIQSATTTTPLTNNNIVVLSNPNWISAESIENEDQSRERVDIESNTLIAETTTISSRSTTVRTVTTTMGNQHGTKTHPTLAYQAISNKGSNASSAGASSSSLSTGSDPSNPSAVDTTSSSKRVGAAVGISSSLTTTNANEGGGGFDTANNNVVKKRGPRETPDLYVYASYRNWELAKKQIELNRGLEYVSTNRRFSVLHVAVENNAPVEIIKMLLDKGMDPNVVDTLFRQSPLHILMKILNDGGNAFEIMRALIDHGANVNAQAKYGRTPLYCAVKYRVSESSVMFLLKSGALVSQEELIFAREKSSRSMALLLEKVSIMTTICSSHLQRCTRKRPDGTILLGRSTNLSTLPVELLRELKRFLYR